MEASLSFRSLKTNGINLHFAEQGSGPSVLMLHGFPEFWYSWRHQIPVLAQAGYHVIAPDMRGFGKSDIPDGVEKYTVFHIVGDIIGLLDALYIEQVFVVGHDWGAYIAWYLCLLRPDRVKGLVAISAQYMPHLPTGPPVQNLREVLGEGFYICRFQEPGRAEADFANVGYANILKKIMFYEKDELWIASPNQEFSDVFDESSVAPAWISLEEINFYADQFQKTGFTGGLNYYRVADKNWELLAPWSCAKVVTPALFITGSKDVVYGMPGVKDYVKDKMKDFVPNLKEIVVLEGAHHFMHEEKPDVVNKHILDFLKEFPECKL